LLVNLGTPDAPAPASLRRYLAEFLSDPRVVPLPRIPWWLILHGFILRTRPRRIAHAYRLIWSERGSPLRLHTQDLSRGLEAALGGDIPVAVAMRYGAPSLADGLAELTRQGVQRVLVLPLYPQYSAATSASVLDGLAKVLRTQRDIPELRFLHDYHDDPGYIEALAESVRRQKAEKGATDCLLISFHGLPCSEIEAGDPYQGQCEATAEALARALRLEDGAWRLAYQSRVGKQAWTQPYTDEVLLALAAQGTGTVRVICPGFAVDCLETLEEINIRYREKFLDAGGVRLDYVPALNAHSDHSDLLAALARRHLWVSPS